MQATAGAALEEANAGFSAAVCRNRQESILPRMALTLLHPFPGPTRRRSNVYGTRSEEHQHGLSSV